MIVHRLIFKEGGKDLENFEYVIGMLLFYSIHREVDISDKIRLLDEVGLLDWLDENYDVCYHEDDRNICDDIDSYLLDRGIEL